MKKNFASPFRLAAFLAPLVVTCQAHAQEAASQYSNSVGGPGLVPLLSRVFPALPLEVLAAGVATFHAVFVLTLMGLGSTVAIRMWRSWAASHPIAVSPARLERFRTAAPPRASEPGRRDTTPWHAPARSRAADSIERSKSDDESRRMRIRDRFIYVRFDGALQGCADFARPAKVVKAARLYFEDDKGERAEELLVLALRHHPEQKAFWLARLEIQFLLGDKARYLETAAAFIAIHPGAEEWDSVKRLGARLAPEAEIFHGVEPLPGDHYGPWPDMPNWIQSSWDLTGEVTASEFHHQMRARIEKLHRSHAQRSRAAT